MICLFSKDNTSFAGNGDAILLPVEGKLKQVAGGNYDISLVQPFDPDGKWKLLEPGAVLRVPVPEETIEDAYEGVEADVYVTGGQAEVRAEPIGPTAITYPAWSMESTYQVGDKVSYGGKNYECTYWTDGNIFRLASPPNCSWWKQIANRTSGAAVLATLPEGTELYFIEDAGSGWYKMSTTYGIIGYVLASAVTYSRHKEAEESAARTIEEQLFRITGVDTDTKNRRVNVTAQHVSYDLSGIVVRDVSFEQAPAAMAISFVVGALTIPYNGAILTNLTSDESTYTGEFKGKNGTFCFLDPDSGIAAHFKAMVKRDNWDIFILEKTETDRGYRLQYGKNTLGVNWSRKTDNIITRIIPVAKDAGGNDYYLPDMWVDSEHIDDYPIIRMEVLKVSGQIGKQKSETDTEVWTEETLQAEMQQKAEERFTVDKVDIPEEEITVDMVQLRKMAEFETDMALMARNDGTGIFQGIEDVLLYDTVLVENEEIGLSKKLTVTELEWDIVAEKILAIKLSTENAGAGDKVPSYTIQDNSISDAKISATVIPQIVSNMTNIMPQFSASVMTGATSTADGRKGLVPAPQAGQQGRYLRGDATWGIPFGQLTPDDFGAYGDGIHDDGPALQAALASENPIVMNRDLHIFTQILVTDKNVQLDGNGFTIYIHGANMDRGRVGGSCIRIDSSITKSEVEGADVIMYTENTCEPLTPAHPNYGYRRGYLSYHGLNPTPEQEVYTDYSAISFMEHRAHIEHTKFIGYDTSGMTLLSLRWLCNSIVDDCYFTVGEGEDALVGLQVLHCYNVKVTRITAKDFTAKTCRHISNTGYGIALNGDAITCDNCTTMNCKHGLVPGGGGECMTTGLIVTNLTSQIKNKREEADTGAQLYEQVIDIHPGCIRPMFNNIYIEYENDTPEDSWGTIINASCPEVFLSNVYCHFHSTEGYSMGYIGFGPLVRKVRMDNVHGIGCKIFGHGWSFENGGVFTANYIREIDISNSEIYGIRNALGVTKIRMENTRVTGTIIDTMDLTATHCFFRSVQSDTDTPIKIAGEARFIGCEIYGAINEAYKKTKPVFKAPANSLYLTGCVIRKPLDVAICDTEQEHIVNCAVDDLWGLILGSQVTASYIDGDECALNHFNLW